ncbi:MAG: ABC transporter permease subunit [Oscillospiraceae bacterium]|uniref:ABC transporter permease n=1 Tax=Neglectibacter timonensis TaxID=1776382 RepID=UPI002EA17D7C|nr:ABC transporter permease subunit [Oscillospiraceae bacterium]
MAAKIVGQKLSTKDKFRKNCKGIRRNWQLYLLLVPAVVLLFCFTYIPMYGIQIAFKDFVPKLGIEGSKWVGFEHFQTFFNSFQVKSLFTNTITLSLYSLIAGFPFPIILALMMNQIRVKRFKQTLQVVTYLPHFISTVVMVGIMLIVLSPSSGLFGNIARMFGVIDPPNLMGQAGAFQSIYVWSDVWQHAGWDSIIYIAALAAVDPSLYEAATVDGAGKWQKIKYIDIPFLLPTAVILLIMRAGNIMNVGFEKVYLMQNPLNTMVSEIIATYVYKIGIISNQYSLSAAVGLFNNVINFILLLLVNQVSKKMGDTSLF